MKSSLFGAACAGLVGLLASITANATIVYNVNRTIGAGTVTGFIETDGTIGTLAAPNITDFQLTLEATNLLAPNPYTLTYGAANQYYQVNGTGLVASLTEITFDFSLPYGHNFFVYNYGDAHYYCVHTTECFTDSPGPAETFGPGPGYVHAQREVRSGTVTIATVGAGSAVPVPAAVWLFGSGLLGLVGIARRRKVT